MLPPILKSKPQYPSLAYYPFVHRKIKSFIKVNSARFVLHYICYQDKPILRFQ